jgi:hemerythrin superfamily protein
MASSTRGDVDGIQLLIDQHNEARRILNEIETATGGSKKKAFERLVRLLAVHETAEEEVIYPVLQGAGDSGAEVADARRAEEDEAKKVLSELEKMDVAGTEFATKFPPFKQKVLQHAANEEREVFPRLRAMESTEQLERLGDALRAAERVAPTHAHANAPESAAGNLVVGPFVALVDRVRDAMRRKSA